MVIIKRDHINKLAIRRSCTAGPLLCHGGISTKESLSLKSLNLSLNLAPTWLLFYCLLIPIRKPKYIILLPSNYIQTSGIYIYLSFFLSPTFSNNKKLIITLHLHHLKKTSNK
jgi:hypothetical protein